MKRSRGWVVALACTCVGWLLIGPPAVALYEPQLRWGGPGSSQGLFNQPYDVAVDDAGNVYVADTANDRVQRFSATGAFITSWGTPGSADGQFGFAAGIAVDRYGDVYVSDATLDRVQKFSPSGTFITKWGTAGTADGQFDDSYGIDIGPTGDVYVAERGNNRVQRFTSAGVFISKFGMIGGAPGQLHGPAGVAVNDAGQVYVAEFYGHRIQQFSAAGVYVRTIATVGNDPGEVSSPWDVALDSSGNLFVTEISNHRLQKLSMTGVPLAVLGGSGSAPAQLSTPVGVDVDEAGSVYVSDLGSNFVQRFRARLPNTTATGPSGLIKDPTPTFTLTSTINPSTFECRVKGSGVTFKACTSPYTTPELDDGLNVVLVRAVDAHNLKDATPFEAELRVDATKPLTFIDSGPAATTKDRTPTFVFSSNERGTFQCSLDGGAFTACASPRTTAQLSYAKHAFRVRARDRAGNLDATPAAKTFTVIR